MCEEIIVPLREYLHHVNDFRVLIDDSKLYNIDDLWGIFREDGSFIIIYPKLNKNNHISLYAINHKNREIITEGNWENGEFTIISEYDNSPLKAKAFKVKEIIPFYNSDLISLNTCFKLEHEVNYYLDEKLITYEEIINKQLTK